MPVLFERKKTSRARRLEKVVGAGGSSHAPAPHQDSVRGYDLVSSTAQQGHLKWEPAFAVVADWANPKSPSRKNFKKDTAFYSTRKQRAAGRRLGKQGRRGPRFLQFSLVALASLEVGTRVRSLIIAASSEWHSLSTDF